MKRGPALGPGLFGKGSELPLELALEGVALCLEHARAPTLPSSLVHSLVPAFRAAVRDHFVGIGDQQLSERRRDTYRFRHGDDSLAWKAHVIQRGGDEHPIQTGVQLLE